MNQIPVPGSCKGYYSSEEEVCTKLCILSEECEIATRERLEGEKNVVKVQKNAKKNVSSVAGKTLKLYKRIVVHLKKELNYDDLSEYDEKIAFKRSGKTVLKVYCSVDGDGISVVKVRTLTKKVTMTFKTFKAFEKKFVRIKKYSK